MRKRFITLIAELITPESHNPWRWELKNKILRKLGITIGIEVAIDNNFECLFGDKLLLEDNVVIGKNVKIYNFSDISIGKFCMFAGEILISNGGHNKNNFEPFSKFITIGSGCWVGAGAKIVGNGITIGNNAIVGAGALVNKDVPPCAVVAGIPAKIIGYRDLPDKVWHLGNTWFSPHTFEKLKKDDHISSNS